MGEERRQTEQALSGVAGIDTWDDRRILETLVAGQERAIAAVRAALPQIATAAEVLSRRLAAGGSLIYAGAGASIRLAVQDGSELPATFGMPEERILYFIAGGREAMFDTSASAEDDVAGALRAAAACTAADTMIAVAASGSTPYTVAVAEEARRRGCFVIAVTNNGGSRLAAVADLEIMLPSGPEVIAGSTRLGAGTAQKAALNLLSTLAHIRLGAVHDGLMVNVHADNAKLKIRARGIVMTITGAPAAAADAALAATHGHVKPAVLICAGAVSDAAAQELLAAAGGNLRLALAKLAGP